ncbi:MAG: CZB domain-containing protein [Georgfuchsia sp.]
MQRSTPGLSSDKQVTIVSDDNLQVLLFKLGTRSFGVPLEHVRYVARMPSDFASSGPEAEGHFVFEGNPLTYVSLWDELGMKSEYIEYEEMQAMLPQRLQDHIDWMSALENSIQTGTAFAKARSPRECAFGKWFYAYHPIDRRLSLLLRQFESPHAMIHGLADRLLGMERGDAMRAFEEAKNTTLATLLRLFDDAQKLIVELQRRIAIIVINGADTCAIGADSVRDIVDVPVEQVKRNEGKTPGVESNAASALIILDDRTVIPLLNWHKFCGAGAKHRPIH